MTDDEKIAQGHFTVVTNAETGEVTQVPHTDEMIAAGLENANQTPATPTKEELLAKLEELTAQIQALS